MRLSQRVDARAAKLAGHLLGASGSRERPRPADPLRPYAAGRRFTFSHYNVVIADLPEPHRHLTCMVLLGRAGVEVFDHDHLIEGSPRSTATVSIGTAATGSGWFTSYNTRTECELREDGSYLRFGDALTIEGSFPDYRVTVDRPGLRLELDVHCTGQVTWFTHSVIYDHVAYPARYEGTLTFQGEARSISGVLSLEHARVLSFTAIADRNIPARLKLPWNFFTYQVIQLDDDTTLMFSQSEAFQQPAITAAWLKQLDGRSERWVKGQVSFEVIDYEAEARIGPGGSRVLLPRHFRWRIRDDAGDVTTEINGRTDTDFVYGVGKGWIGGYSYTGVHEGERVGGTAYIEYARTR